MWVKLAHTIIKYRLWLVIVLGLFTLFMGYHAKDVQMSYDFAKTVPSNDPDMVEFEKFKALFGEDGNIAAIGILDSAIFRVGNFKRLKDLSDSLRTIAGVTEVISLPLVKRMKKDNQRRTFHLEPIFKNIPDDQQSLDSMLRVALDQKFYEGQLINSHNGATMIIIAVDREYVNSEKREGVTRKVIALGDTFEQQTGINVKYAGLTFLRSIIAFEVRSEMVMFLLLSIGVTGLILLLFFRSWDAVVFPIIIIAVVVIWVLGSIKLFGFKITLLTGLIPPLITVIGIPNSVYLLNKYHQEYEQHGNKMMAISRVIRKIGIVTFITNFTTAVGFLVLLSTKIVILQEFGVVAGLNIMATFLVSIILIPAVFSWLPPPTVKQLKHLKLSLLDRVLTGMDLLVHRHRLFIYFATAGLITIALIGMYRIDAISYVVDDIPRDSQIKQDLAFFEENFSGIMPLEIIVDTGKKRGVLDLDNLKKIDELEQFLAAQENISSPVSLVNFVKASKQAFYNNNPDRYLLPTKREKNFILRYLRNQNDSSGLFNAFVDSSLQKMRISLQVADVGSDKMDSLVNQVIQPEISSLFGDTDLEVHVTGTTPLFVKGNKFLIDNLLLSLMLAFFIIALIMALLFANVRMILISIVPNIIPLVITAGIMGFTGIPLKPSTALIFCIVFGISIDDSIHYLAKYRQELFANKFFVPVAVSRSLRETGASMIYTSIILFAGFIIFAWSSFGGTLALGILTSITLLIAMVTNLILLPSLLLSFDDGKRRKDRHPLIEQYDDGFYQELDDEEIDLNLIRVNNGVKEGLAHDVKSKDI